VHRIDLSGSAYLIWHNVIVYASKHRLLESILRQVRELFPEDELIGEAAENGLREGARAGFEVARQTSGLGGREIFASGFGNGAFRGASDPEGRLDLTAWPTSGVGRRSAKLTQNRSRKSTGRIAR